MTLLRLIALLVVAWYAWRMLDRWLTVQNRKRTDAGTRPRVAGKVVKCNYCDVHLPETEAVKQDELWFCSSRHAQDWLTEH